MKLSKPKSVTIGLEVGLQNGTTALLVTSTILENPVMAIPPAVYSLIMFGTGGVFAFLVTRGSAAVPVSDS
jgi:BASS family bile acid:Na+ symporter